MTSCDTQKSIFRVVGVRLNELCGVSKLLWLRVLRILGTEKVTRQLSAFSIIPPCRQPYAVFRGVPKSEDQNSIGLNLEAVGVLYSGCVIILAREDVLKSAM